MLLLWQHVLFIVRSREGTRAGFVWTPTHHTHRDDRLVTDSGRISDWVAFPTSPTFPACPRDTAVPVQATAPRANTTPIRVYRRPTRRARHPVEERAGGNQ